MKKKKNLKKLFGILFALGLFSCAKVPIKNHEFCGDMGVFGAYCFFNLSDEEREISKQDWDNYRLGMICTSSESYADLKSTITKLCRETNRCKKEEIEKVNFFFERIDHYEKIRKNRFDD